MSMPRACPRCSARLDPFPRTVPGAQPFEADMCRYCYGVWYDAGEVAAAHPALAELRWLPASTRAPARRPAPCPRCGAGMALLPFLHLTLDYCTACHGVWVDGGEHQALADARRSAPLGTPGAEGPFRGGGAAAALSRGAVVCAACQREVPLRASLMTSGGAMCEPCAQAREEAGDPEVDALRDAAGGGDMVSREWGAWRFVREVGGALGSLLGALSAEHGPTCGRPHGRCSH